MQSTELRDLLDRLRAAEEIPDREILFSLLGHLISTLATEPADRRPADRNGLPGGVIYLRGNLPTVVLPDIHARPGLVTAALDHTIGHGLSVLDGIAEGKAQLVCVGDYFHGEGRVRNRWRAAQSEYANGYASHAAMDREMAESLTALMMAAVLKIFAPDRVHLLKGNHENVANEAVSGNHPFVKFANEGAMVSEYLKLVYDMGILARIYYTEKRLPLLAVGPHFLISHAEPARTFEQDEVIDYRNREDVVHGLTWTDNDESEAGAVERMLTHFLPSDAAEKALYFGGHRPVPGVFALRANGKYVQIHNPGRYIVAVLPADRPPDADRDIVDLGPNKDADDGALAG